MKYTDKLDELYKQANEDDDNVLVCNKCGKPLCSKEGGCKCDGGKGASTKKQFLEQELADKLASEELDELYKKANYSHDFKVPNDYIKCDISEDIKFHNNLYESEGIKAPKFGKDLFPIAEDGWGNSYVVDKRSGKPELKFFNHESPEELEGLSTREMIDFGLKKFKPSERQNNLINSGIHSHKDVDNMKSEQLNKYIYPDGSKPPKVKLSEPIILPALGGLTGLTVAVNKDLPSKKMLGLGAGATALGLGANAAILHQKKLKTKRKRKEQEESMKKKLKEDIDELSYRGVLGEKKASDFLEELCLEKEAANGSRLGNAVAMGLIGAGLSAYKLSEDKKRKKQDAEHDAFMKEKNKKQNPALSGSELTRYKQLEQARQDSINGKSNPLHKNDNMMDEWKGLHQRAKFNGQTASEKKASDFLDELCLEKEAANTDLGPVDWGKQKTIPLGSSEFKVRDAKFGEALGHNAKEGAKAAGRAGIKAGKAGAKAGKAGAKFAKRYGQMVKAAPMTGLLPAAGLAVGASSIASYKRGEKEREHDTKTRGYRDQLVPDNIRAMKSMPISIAGAATSVLVGPRIGAKLGARAANKIALKTGQKGQKAADTIIKGMKVGAGVGMAVPITAGALGSNHVQKKSSIKKLDKLSNKYLGRDATEAEKKVFKKKYSIMTHPSRRTSVTPESEVQKRRRAMAKKEKEKKASDFLEELYMEKSAGNIAEAIKKNSKGHYCMHCEHSSKERYTLENNKYKIADPRNKDGEYVKCTLVNDFFKKEHGKDCDEFGTKSQEKKASELLDKYEKANNKTDVCEVCGTPRDEQKQPHCPKCSHDHTIGEKDYYKKKLANQKSQEKQASEKWTKQDKKGLIRNMAINTAQDFVNAGNPLNVGSHIVGSVMDSALMEGMTMKMNKKLQAQKINERKMAKFNDTKGLTNGTTAVKAVKSTPKAIKGIANKNNN